MSPVAASAGSLVGLVAAAIAAVYPNLWINDSLVMSESLALLIVAVALIVALDFDRSPSVGRAVALGVLVGLGTLTRSEIALFAIGFAVLAWWRAAGHPRRALIPVLVVVASALTIAPWVVYNLARFSEPVLLSTNDGTTLLGANCDQTYYDDIGGWDIRCLDASEEGVDASVRSRARRAAAVDYAGDHVGRLPVVVAARLGRIVDVYGLRNLVALDRGEEKAAWAVWTGIVMWWLLAVAAVAGWVVLGRRAGRGPLVARRPRRVGVDHDDPVLRRPPDPRPAEPVVVLLAAVASGRAVGTHARDTLGRVIDSKLAALSDELVGLGRVVVALSGGADSAFLAAVANTALGADRAHAVTAVSPSLAGAEHDDCRALAAELGLRWTPVRTDEMARAAYRVNDLDRCYHCKAELMDVLAPIAERERATVVLGVNVDDVDPWRGDHRPGQRAALEAGAAFPLVVAGFTKAEVREASRTHRTADVGQAGGGVPRQSHPVRDGGVSRRAVEGRAGRGGVAVAGVPAGARAPLRRHRPHRGRAGRPGARARRAGGDRRRRSCRRLPLRHARPRGLPVGESQRVRGTVGWP